MPEDRARSALRASGRQRASAETSRAARDGDEAEAPGEPRSRLTLDIVEDGGDWSDAADLHAAIMAVAGVLGGHAALAPVLPGQASVVLSDDATVRALNYRWRGQDKATNVLSFPAGGRQPDAGARQLGDVVLAAGTIAREAQALAVPFDHHLQHLVVHGLLHLAGYDHEDRVEAERMEALERELLAQLAVPDPYADSDPVMEDVRHDRR